MLHRNRSRWSPGRNRPLGTTADLQYSTQDVDRVMPVVMGSSVIGGSAVGAGLGALIGHVWKRRAGRGALIGAGAMGTWGIVQSLRAWAVLRQGATGQRPGVAVDVPVAQKPLSDMPTPTARAGIIGMLALIGGGALWALTRPR